MGWGGGVGWGPPPLYRGPSAKRGVSSCTSHLSDTDGGEFNLTRPRVVVFATLITAACKDGPGKLLRKILSLQLYVRFCWTCELRPLRIHHSDALAPQSGTRQGRKSRRRSSEHARLTSRLTLTAARDWNFIERARTSGSSEN